MKKIAEGRAGEAMTPYVMRGRLQSWLEFTQKELALGFPFSSYLLTNNGIATKGLAAMFQGDA